MKRVITYGTFDLFHEGHRRLLERARLLGDYLIVGVTSASYDNGRGKLNVRESLVQRIQNVTDSGLADEIVVEEYEGQKIHDIQRLDVDVFAIGSDWVGRFDYLADYCEVTYLERTKGISSTGLRAAGGLIRMGIVGAGRIARRFVNEARFVSGVNVEAVWTRRPEKARDFADEFELQWANDTYADLLKHVDAVYIATPHETHVSLSREAMQAGVHVLCEKPIALRSDELEALYAVADQNSVVLLEALKTAFSPGFQRMVAIARSGSIGAIRAVDATFTKLVGAGRELEGPEAGALAELGSYPFLAIIKLLGLDPETVHTRALRADGVDTFARVTIDYPHSVASATVGLGVKSEGDLVVSGSEGYVYVPAPWWLTEYFETRFEDPTRNSKYFCKYDGDGLRYELAEFISMILDQTPESFKLRRSESLAVASLLERARSDAHSFDG